MNIQETEEIVEETQREAIINRPYNLAGSIKRVNKERFNVNTESIRYGNSNIVPALLKLFMESLDNPIDVAIKGGCSVIDIKVDEKSIRVKDNGYGVSTLDDANGESILLKAFSKYNTSSNYKEKKGKGQKGVNGIGIKLCTTLSTHFEVTSEDRHGKKKITITENNLHSKIKELKKTGKTGLEVYFEPDFSIFEVNEIDEEHISRMYEYTLMQALTYPEVTFRFNGKAVKIKPKQFLKLLSEDIVMEEHDNYFLGIVPNDTGDFKQLSYVNGLEIVNGGTHVEVVLETIIRNLRTKIAKKYKSIKPGDIRSKLTFVLIAKNMKNIDWEGQVKDKIASTSANIKKYFSETDLDKFSDKVYKNKTIIDSIINYFKIAEEFKRQQELSKMDKKTKKKPKDDKFLAPVGEWESILLCEGDCLEENTELLDENFKPKKIKDFRQNDLIISGDGSIQKIESVTKSLRDMVYIKTKSGIYECSEKHRWYVYNKETREFIFESAKNIVANKNIFSMVKSRVNKNLYGTNVLENKNDIIYCDNGNIYYTENDYFLIYRNDNFKRIHANKIVMDDTILFT